MNINKNKYIIGIFGGALSSVNYGCTALTLTQLSLLEKISKEKKCSFEYWIFADESTDVIEKVKRQLDLDNTLEGKYVVRLKTGINGIRKLQSDIEKCSLIIDLTYGDSFSDIYGKKFFYLYSMPKIIALKTGKLFVLGPQTYGPYYSLIVRKIARRILQKIDYVVARDELSKECILSLLPSKKVVVTSDLAMNLPYDNVGKMNVDGQTHVGLNVSSLLWRNEEESNHISLKLSYKKLTMQILDLLEEYGFTVHLFAHVFENGDFTEYTLAEKLHKSYSRFTTLAPQFADPIEAKTFMSSLDLMIGARMHATIGAFSSGVPVIPIAYSRKFKGLYSSIGYNYIIDCAEETNDSAIIRIREYLSGLEIMKKQRDISFAMAQSNNHQYTDLLSILIDQLINNGDK